MTNIKILAPNSNISKLIYNEKASEFEIQSYLYSKLQDLGLNVRGVKGLSNSNFKNARFDLVIFNKENIPKLIIECKNSPGHNTDGKTLQAQKYREYGVHLAYALSIKEADQLIAKLIKDNKHLITVSNFEKYRKFVQILSNEIEITTEIQEIVQENSILDTWFSLAKVKIPS